MLHLDPRSLGLFRIALGCVVVVVALQLLPDAPAFYSSCAHPQLIGWILSLVLPLFGTLLALGLGCRASAVVCWICLVVVQDANPHVLSGADRLLRVLLFWSIFLPLDSSLSLRAWLGRKPRLNLPLTDYWAGWAITLQISFVYWYTALAKSDPVWTRSHDALFFALSLDYLTSPAGLYLRHFPSLLRVLTVLTLALEYIGPFLLFVPFQRDRFRLAAVILFVAFHLIGMQLVMRIGYFPWICAVAWLIFIPPFFWDILTGASQRLSAAIPPAKRLRFLDRVATSLVFLSFADVVLWNVLTLWSPDHDDELKARDPLQPILHLDQHWRMYAPMPYPDHGWLVIPAELADGTEIDLFTGRPLSWSKPANLSAYVGDYRWASLIGDLLNNQEPAQAQWFGDYFVSQWNAGHPEVKVRTVSVVYLKQTTLPDLTVTEPKQMVLYTRQY